MAAQKQASSDIQALATKAGELHRKIMDALTARAGLPPAEQQTQLQNDLEQLKANGFLAEAEATSIARMAGVMLAGTSERSSSAGLAQDTFDRMSSQGAGLVAMTIMAVAVDSSREDVARAARGAHSIGGADLQGAIIGATVGMAADIVLGDGLGCTAAGALGGAIGHSMVAAFS